jgi:hypothetical protein
MLGVSGWESAAAPEAKTAFRALALHGLDHQDVARVQVVRTLNAAGS